MSIDHFPIGQKMDVIYPDFKVSLSIRSVNEMTFRIDEGPFAHSETVAIDVVPLGNCIFAVSWKEESGATVTNIQDHDRGIVHSFVTLADGGFLRMNGPIAVTSPANHPSDARPRRNKALVLEAMTALFQRREADAVEQLYALDYVQHNPNIPQGRDALRSLVADLSPDVFYEPGLMVAEGDFVAIHGRIAGWSATPQIVVDIFRIENGKLAEHWDVLQDEVAAADTLGRAAMFELDERKRQPGTGA